MSEDPAPENPATPSNVEIVRRVYERWADGDMNAGVDLFDPEIDFQSFMPDANELRTCTGPDEVAAFMRDFLGSWRDYRLIGSEFEAVGDDAVFVTGAQTATGGLSGVEVEMPMHSFWRFRDGRITQLLFHHDRETALEVAGLG